MVMIGVVLLLMLWILLIFWSVCSDTRNDNGNGGDDV